MKNKFLVSLFAFALVLSGGLFYVDDNTAYAQGASQYAPGHQYNFSFRFRNEERHIRTQDDFQLLLRDMIRYMLELQERIQIQGSEVEVTTNPATDITDDSAVLEGEVTEFNDSEYAIVWFVYGRDKTALTTETGTEQLDNSSNGLFSKEVSGLKVDTQYYFRAVARDDEGKNDYGTILHFTTGDNTSYLMPDVTTRNASNITDDSVTLRGLVDMNDYNDGQVFFVYGTDQDLIEEVADEFETYDAIGEYGDDRQKVLVDSDLDGNDEYEEGVASLNNDTTYYFRICVGYEDEDDEDTLVCGSVRSFDTDN